MAKVSKGVDLYEAFARKRNVGNLLPRPQAETPRPEAPPPPSRTGRELVFSLDLGFVLFVATVIICGSAYYLGYQRGQAEARPRSPGLEVAPPAEAGATIGPLKGLEGSPPADRVVLPKESFTLRLRTSAKHGEVELKRLQEDQAYVRGLEAVKLRGLEVYIFDNGQVYSLGLGIFEARTDPQLAELQKALAEEKGPATSRGEAPYRSCSPVRLGELGEVLAN